MTAISHGFTLHLTRMKNILFLLFGLLVLAGCKKTKDVKPKTAVEVTAGLYTLSSFSDGTNTLPLPITLNGVTFSGTANVVGVAGQDAQVDITLVLKQTGSADQTQTLSGVQLQAATAGGYTMTYQTQNAGTIDGTTITLKDDQSKTTVIGKK